MKFREASHFQTLTPFGYDRINKYKKRKIFLCVRLDKYRPVVALLCHGANVEKPPVYSGRLAFQ
jgi:hypothetical protein